MLEIREFELKARDIFRSGQMPGFIHVYVGEEAVAVGVRARLRTHDYIASTHRGHGHGLARGISARSVMAELMDGVDGCSGGRGDEIEPCDQESARKAGAQPSELRAPKDGERPRRTS